MKKAGNYLTNSRTRAAQSPSVGPTGLVSSNYKLLVGAKSYNRYRNNYVPRNLVANAANLAANPNPLYNTYKITLPMGTVMFRAAGSAPDPMWNMQKTKFHYFHPLGGLAVVGLSHQYNRFCMFALKYDTTFFLLIDPGNMTKQWVTQRNTATGLVQLDQYGQPVSQHGVDDMLNKDLCRAAGVQGWIGLSGMDAREHDALAKRYPSVFPPSLTTNAGKFVHTNAYLKTQGVMGFPECVMWYEDLQYNPTNAVVNRAKKMVIEPIVCLHMPRQGTEPEKVDYLVGFYTKCMNEGLLEARTHARVTGGGTIPFAHFVFPNMSTKAKVKEFVSTPRQPF
jgi:hypothetical protein